MSAVPTDNRIDIQAVRQADERPTSAAAPFGLSALDALLCLAVFGAMCAYTPFLYTWFWAPRMAILLAAVPCGLIALGHLARCGDRAARFAVAFIAWAIVAAIFSDNTWLSLRGTIAQNTSVLVFAAGLGLWALAQFMTGPGRRLLLGTVIVGASLNAVAGTLQVVLQLGEGNLGLLGGRAVGLTPNPIELAAFMLVGVFACMSMISEGHFSALRPAVVGLFAFSTVLAFTSTRVAFISFFVVSLGVLVARRNRAQLAGAAVALLGIVSGTVIARVAGADDAVARSTALNDSGRPEFWRTGWVAFTERPVLGWGVGRFRIATQGELSTAYAAVSGDSQAIPDAHNIFVSMTVELGVVGLLLLIMFAVCVARRASGVYSLALLAVPIVWLLQPIAMTTLIVYVVMLGVAVSTVSEGNSTDSVGAPARSGLPPSVGTRVWVGALLLGIGAASWLLVAEYRLSEAALSYDREAFDSAAAMYFGDPIVSDVGVAVWAARSLYEDDFGSELIDRLTRTVELEPSRAYWHARLAWGLAHQGRFDDATASANRALDLQPTSELAWRTLAFVGETSGDATMRRDATETLCRLRPPTCNVADADY